MKIKNPSKATWAIVQHISLANVPCFYGWCLHCWYMGGALTDVPYAMLTMSYYMVWYQPVSLDSSRQLGFSEWRSPFVEWENSSHPSDPAHNTTDSWDYTIEKIWPYETNCPYERCPYEKQTRSLYEKTCPWNSVCHSSVAHKFFR